MGLIVPEAARSFSVEVTSMAAQFTWFTGGVFVGYIASFVVFDHFSIKRILLASYLACLASLIMIHANESYELLSVWLAMFGIFVSIAICGSGTLITQLWAGQARQTVLVAQDAMFNGGGVIFSAVATWFITRSFPYSSIYLVVAAIVLMVMILVLAADFQSGLIEVPEEDQELETEWNAGIILIGVSLLLFMLAKISIFIWAPQYVEQRFNVGSAVSGEFMSRIFIAALIGSLVGTWLVSRMPVKYLLYTFVVVSVTAVWLFTEANDVASMMIFAFVYGISVSATFNAYVAFALTFVAVPTHRNIAYLLLMSALGSSGAPYFSSLAVEMSGEIGSALTFCFLVLLAVIATLVTSEILNNLSRKTGAAVTDAG